jgi:hypothetical protein
MSKAVSAEEVKRTMTVVPSKNILSLSPGETWQGEVKIASEFTEPTNIYVVAQDFKSNNQEGGTPQFYIASEDMSGGILSRWIKLSKSELLLTPGVYDTVKVTIKVPVNAPPGGHYGAVLFSTSPIDSRINNSGSLITSTVAALFIVTVEGDIKEDGKIAEFYAKSDVFEATPAEFVLRVQNLGNTHTAPSGVMEIYNEFGTQIDNIEITNDGYILPQDIRRFQIKWGQSWDIFGNSWYKIGLGDPLAFGFYKAKLTLWYGDQQKVLQATETFFVFPWRLFLVLFAATILIWLMIKLFLRRYTQELLERRRHHPGNRGHL